MQNEKLFLALCELKRKLEKTSCSSSSSFTSSKFSLEVSQWISNAAYFLERKEDKDKTATATATLRFLQSGYWLYTQVKRANAKSYYCLRKRKTTSTKLELFSQFCQERSFTVTEEAEIVSTFDYPSSSSSSLPASQVEIELVEDDGKEKPSKKAKKTEVSMTQDPESTSMVCKQEEEKEEKEKKKKKESQFETDRAKCETSKHYFQLPEVQKIDMLDKLKQMELKCEDYLPLANAARFHLFRSKIVKHIYEAKKRILEAQSYLKHNPKISSQRYASYCQLLGALQSGSLGRYFQKVKQVQETHESCSQLDLLCQSLLYMHLKKEHRIYDEKGKEKETKEPTKEKIFLFTWNSFDELLHDLTQKNLKDMKPKITETCKEKRNFDIPTSWNPQMHVLMAIGFRESALIESQLQEQAKEKDVFRAMFFSFTLLDQRQPG